MDHKTKDFSGVLFKNDKRETESHPNAKGSALIDGKEYWVSAWTNTSAKGTVYQSLSFKAKDEVHAAGIKKAKAAIDDDFSDDDLPF